MADLPRIFAKPNLPEAQLPRTNPEAYGYGFFGALAHATEELRKQEQPVLAAQLKAEYDVGLDAIRQNLGGDQPPENWESAFAVQEGKLRQGILKKTTDQDVLTHVQTHMAERFGQGQIQVLHDSLRARSENNLARLDNVESAALNKISQSGSTIDAFNIMNQHIGLIQSQAVSGPASLFNPKQAEDRIINFRTKAMSTYLGAQMAKDPIGVSQMIDSGAFNGVLDQATLGTIEERAYRRADHNMAELDKKVKDAQKEVERGLMVQVLTPEANPNMTKTAIDSALVNRQITVDQHKELSKSLDAQIVSGGVTASDRATYDRLEFRARFGGIVPGVQSLGPNEIRDNAGKLSRPDKDHLDTIVAENLRRRDDENDISKDPAYKRQMARIKQTLPNTDLADIDQKTKVIVGNAINDFDRASRDPKYAGKLDTLGDQVIAHAFSLMGKSGVELRAKLPPSIKTEADVGDLRRKNLITGEQAINYLNMLKDLRQLEGARGATPLPPGSGSPVNRNDAARQQFQNQVK